MSGLFKAVLVTTLLGSSALVATGCGCDVADEVMVLDTTVIGGQEYHLVSRTTGFQEKETFLELYTAPPKFDSCGQPSVQPTSKELFDLSEGRLRGVQVEGKTLRLLYTKISSQGIEVSEARLPR
jgi:hypothetical protein